MREFEEQINGILGEASDQLVREPIEPVAIPQAYLGRDTDLDQLDTKHAGMDAYYLSSVTAHQVDVGREHRTTYYRRARLLTRQGVNDLSLYTFGFDPLAERLFVNQVVVYNANGDEVWRGTPKDSYVADDNSGGVASQDKVLHVPIPGIAVGSVLELSVSRIRLAAPDRIPFVAHLLSNWYPVELSSVLFRGNTDSLSSEVTPRVNIEVGDGEIVWSVREPERFSNESKRPSAADYLPGVRFSQAGVSWEEEVTKYRQSIEHRLVTDPSIAALALELTADQDQESDKLEALIGYVQGTISYRALEFGRRGRVPEAPSVVLENRYGDCKDQSLLLHQLLDAAGVVSRLTLVNTSGPVYRELASMNQFDHMIVFCPSVGAGRFIDCTDKYVPPGVSVPLGLTSCEALVLEPEGPSWRTIEPYNVEDCRIVTDRRVKLALDGSATVEDQLTLLGYEASSMRAYLLGEDSERRRDLVRELIASFIDEPELTELELQGLVENREPLTIRSRYMIPKLLHQLDGQLVGSIPAGWERYYLRVSDTEARKAPLEIRYPRRIESSVSLLAPEGHRLAPRGAQSGGSKQTDFGQIQHTATFEASKLEIRYQAQVYTGRFDAARYAEHMAFRSDAIAALEAPILVSRSED